MKTSARFLAMLLAVVMIASAALSVSAFDDVAGNKHANAINVLAQLGVIGGYEDGTFKPDQKVTRAEMAKLVYVLYTTFVDAGTGVTAFSDVAADNWAAGYIRWCAQKGIIGGYGNGTFGPTDNVTYDQALKMVAGVLGYNEWDSALWPTDVRSKALRDLELGENLDDVNGNDQLTRAQVAQIMYNALSKPMKETKTENEKVTLTGGGSYYIPVEKVMTLQADIWKVEEVKATVASANEEKDTVTFDAAINGTTTYDIDKIGFEAYEGKLEDLVGLKVLGLKKTGKTELLGGLTVLGSVVDGVKVEYNKNLDTITIDGVAYTAVLADDDSIDVAKTLKVNGVTAFEKKTVSGKEVCRIIDGLVKDDEATSAVEGTLNGAFMARAIDVDGDAVIDNLVIAPKSAVKVTEIGKTTDKYVTLRTLADASYAKPKAAEISIEVAKDDILVVAKLGNTYYAEKVDAVETYATKLNAKAGKVTLAEVGEVAYVATIAGAATTTIKSENLGAENKTGFYIYDGEIILAEDLKSASEYNFAILKEVVKVEGDDINTETMEAGDSYTATLIVNGEEQKVTLASKPIAGDEVTTVADFYTTYKRGTTAGNKVKYNYALVAAYEEDDGVYTLTMDKKLGDSDVIVLKGAQLDYSASTGLYTIGGYSKVVLDDTSRIYYTYEKDTTGDFKHIGAYTKETITAKDFKEPAVTTSAAYLVTENDGKTYTLLATIVAGEIKGSSADTITYKNDGTLIMYAPVDSNEVYDETDKKSYLEYTFMDNETLENKEAVIDKTKVAKEATATVSGKFYAWSDSAEKYVEVEAKADTEYFKLVTLKEIVEANGKNLLELADGAMLNVADDVTIWGLDATEDKTNDTYVTFTVDELADMLELVADYNEDNKNVEGFVALEVKAIFVQVEDANGDFALDTIIVEVFETNEENDELVERINSTIFAAPANLE